MVAGRGRRASRGGGGGWKTESAGERRDVNNVGTAARAHLGGELHDDAQSVRFGDEGFVVLDDVRRVELREDATLVDGLLLVRAPRAHGDLLDHERALARVALARHSPNHTEGTLAELAQDVEVGHARGVATGATTLDAARGRVDREVGRGAREDAHRGRRNARLARASARRGRHGRRFRRVGRSACAFEGTRASVGGARHAARTRARHHRRRARVVVVSGEPTVRVALTNDSFSRGAGRNGRARLSNRESKPSVGQNWRTSTHVYGEISKQLGARRSAARASVTPNRRRPPPCRRAA